jgi:hypothetical protein
MVLFSEIANQDLDDIYNGLLSWEKFQLERNYVISYVVSIVEECGKLDQLSYHKKARYKAHKEFGVNVYLYRRNRNTTWYIIYDYDRSNNIIYINHITSNHTTKD